MKMFKESAWFDAVSLRGGIQQSRFKGKSKSKSAHAKALRKNR
jgi:hypothetical protein